MNLAKIKKQREISREIPIEMPDAEDEGKGNQISPGKKLKIKKRKHVDTTDPIEVVEDVADEGVSTGSTDDSVQQKKKISKLHKNEVIADGSDTPLQQKKKKKEKRMAQEQDDNKSAGGVKTTSEITERNSSTATPKQLASSSSSILSDQRFSEMPLSEKTMSSLTQMGFEFMTQIQAKSIPECLAGHDLVGAAKTGR